MDFFLGIVMVFVCLLVFCLLEYEMVFRTFLCFLLIHVLLLSMCFIGARQKKKKELILQVLSLKYCKSLSVNLSINTGNYILGIYIKL